MNAVAALALPSAKLTDEENAVIGKTMGFIEDAIRERMKYDGVLIDFPGLPRHLAVALKRLLDKEGWDSTFTPWERAAKLSNNIVQTGFLLQLSPSDKSYAEHAIATRADLQ